MADGRLNAWLVTTFWADHERLPTPLRPGPRGMWRTVGRACAGYAVIVGWVALGTVLQMLDPGWTDNIGILCGLTGIVVLGAVGGWLGGRAAAFRSVEFGGLPLLAAVIGSAFGVPALILAVRGRIATAVIAGAQQKTTGKGAVYYDYLLRTLDGHPVAGLLESGDSTPRAIGAHVRVVLDPAGVASPDFPGSMGTSATVGAVLAACGVVLLAVLITWIAVRTERQRLLWQREGQRQDHRARYRDRHDRQRAQNPPLRAGGRLHGDALPRQSGRRGAGRRRTVR